MFVAAYLVCSFSSTRETDLAERKREADEGFDDEDDMFSGWEGDEDDDDEFDFEGDDDETEDDEDDAGEDEDDTDGDDGDSEDDDLDPKLLKKLDAHKKAIEAEIVAQLSSGDTNSDIHKALQRVISRKDTENAQKDAKIAQLEALIEEMRGQMSEFGDGLQWVSETALGMADDDYKATQLATLKQRQSEAKMKALESRINSQTQKAATPPPAANSEQEDVQAVIARRTAQFVEGRRARAKAAGIDPNDPSLDYGSDEEGLIERLEKFDASLDKAVAKKDEKDIKSLRPAVKPNKTRLSGAGGSARVRASGLLEAAAADIVAAMREADSKRRKPRK